MPKICYKIKKFEPAHRKIIATANTILNAMDDAGYVLTLRQLYYQFVAHHGMKNKIQSYKRLGSIIGEARLCGLIDWDHLEDRVRNLAELQHFDSAQDALNKLHDWYHIDMWSNQRYRPEVWIEKDALSGVIAGVCQENDVPYFSCRGYTSLSEMWRAAMRLQHYNNLGQQPYIIHFGDHDPSGMDMSRDIIDRISKTFGTQFQFERVALNMDQIEEYKPPPNPAKITDSRYKKYVDRYGDESWELDALEPAKFRELIESRLKKIRDKKIWDADAKIKADTKDKLLTLAKNWNKRKPRKKKK